MTVNGIKIPFKTTEVSKPRLVYRDDQGLHYATLGANGLGQGLYQQFGNFKKKVAFSDSEREPIGNIRLVDNKLTVTESFAVALYIYNEDTEEEFRIPAGETVTDLDVGFGYKYITFKGSDKWYKDVYEGSASDLDISVTQTFFPFIYIRPIAYVNEDGEGGVRIPALEADIVVDIDVATTHNGTTYYTKITSQFLEAGVEHTFRCNRRIYPMSGETCSGVITPYFTSWSYGVTNFTNIGNYIYTVNQYEPAGTWQLDVVIN